MTRLDVEWVKSRSFYFDLGLLQDYWWWVGLMGASSSPRLVALLLASLERTAAGAYAGRPS